MGTLHRHSGVVANDRSHSTGGSLDLPPLESVTNIKPDLDRLTSRNERE